MNANASLQYQEYQAFEDSQGNIYLELPKQFVLIHSEISIPLSVYPENALVKLSKDGTQWQVEILSEAQFNALSLTPSDYAIEYIDFSNDGDTEVVLRSNSVLDDSFILYGLENGAVSFSVHNQYVDNIDLSQANTIAYIDRNDDGYKDIIVSPSNGTSEITLLGNAQDGFTNTAPIFTQGQQLIGSTSGEFRVAEDGSASYSIPLALPSGATGITPQLAISYSSNGGGRGLLGQGFNLSGLSGISRCPKNYVQDGMIKGVSLTIDDKYCYNGQALKLTSGNYGAKDSVYHTEIANFDKITITSANAWGALTFKVEMKSGDTYYFGDQSVNAYLGKTTSPTTYMLSSISDVMHNTIEYNYSAGSSTHQEHNLNTITWDNNQAQIHYIENTRSSFGFQQGVMFGNTKLIDAISIKTDDETLRNYKIGWDHGSDRIENFSRVTSITDCLIENDTEHCLAPVKFSWSTPQHSGQTSRTQCTEWSNNGGNSYDDLECIGDFETIYTDTQFSAFNMDQEEILSDIVQDAIKNSLYRFIGDVNGDGISDIFYNSGYYINLLYSTINTNGSITFRNVKYDNEEYDTNEYRYLNTVSIIDDLQYSKLIDLNGDGKVELLVPFNDSWNSFSLNGNNLEYVPVAQYLGDERLHTNVLDVNGDSYIDLVYKRNYSSASENNKLFVKYNNAGSFNNRDSDEQLLDSEVSVLAGKLELNTPTLQNTAFADFNGDGISDFLTLATTKVRKYLCKVRERGSFFHTRATKDTYEEAEAECLQIKEEADDDIDSNYNEHKIVARIVSTDDRPQLLMGSATITNSTAKGDYKAYSSLDFLIGLDISQDVRIADFNGDGLSDFFYHKGSKWYIELSKGDGSFESANVPSGVNGTDLEKYVYHRLMDINGDGKTDILAYTGSQFSMYLAHHSSNGELSFTSRGFLRVKVSSGRTLEFGDFDGDGNIDMLFENNSPKDVRINYSIYQDEKVNTVNMIEEGFGQRTVISYEQINSNDNKIENASTYLSTLEDKRALNNQDYSKYFQSDFMPNTQNIWVVAKVANLAYDSYNAESKTVSVDYKYGGLLFNKLGRGNLGFAKLQTTDNQTNVTTTTTYSQAFPYIGMPLSTLTSMNGKTLNQSTNTLAINSASTLGVHPYIQRSSDLQNHYHTSGITSFASRTDSDFNYDRYGNLINSNVMRYGNSSGSSLLSKVTTSNVYNGAGGGAEKGRLSKTDVIHYHHSDGTTSLESNFTYRLDGLLNTSTVSGLGLKTTYGYTARGNKNSECVEDITKTNSKRCTTTQWSSNERYVNSVTNALGHKESYLYNGQTGDGVTGRVRTKTTTGPNGIATTQFFDIQGQLIKELRANNTETNITRAYANSSNTYQCLNNSEKVCFYEKTESTAKPTSYTWYDAYGRKIKTQVQAFNGSQWSSMYYTFDEQSLGQTTTIAYYESSANGNKPSASVDTSQYFYDGLNRVNSEKLAGYNGSNFMQFNGYQTKYTDANGKTRIEHTNALGQLSKVTGMATSAHLNGQTSNNVINITDYTYDAFGKLTRVDNSASNNTSKKMSIHTLYDAYGRKTAMYDPDKGNWRYTYNAFGELLTQTTAEGNTTTNMYDLAGRMIRSEIPSNDGYPSKVSCYAYGNNKSQNNVGKLIDIRQYSTTSSNLASINCSSASNLEWQQSQTFDYLGRPNNTTTKYDGKTFVQSQTYDSYGRVLTQSLPEGLVVTNHYANNYLKRISQNGYTLREINARNAAGQVTSESIAEGVERENTFDESTGRINTITVEKQGGSTIHHLSYVYDNVGNLTYREHNFQNSHFLEEYFNYDNLHRLTKRTIEHSGLTNNEEFDFEQNYQYDFIGNISKKYSVSDAVSNDVLVHNYTYGWQSHAQSTSNYAIARYRLNRITKDGNTSFRNFTYDNNGNVTNDGTRSYQYTSFDKPYKLISTNGDYSEFKYGPSKGRYQREDHVTENGESVYYKTSYLGAYERVEKTLNSVTTIDHKYQIAGAIITRKHGETAYTRLFAHADVQGSITSITDGKGEVAEQFIYDPWGKKQAIVVNNTVNSLVANMVRGTATTRGYTGHEGISHLGLIHMNGRVYDPEIGRFLQADPHVQTPNNSQNYNRYAYVLNNPMSYTDPSGYFFKKLFGGVAKGILRAIAKVPLLNTAISIGLYFVPGCQSGICTAIYNAASTYAVTGSLKAAAIGFAVSQISPGGYGIEAILARGVIGGLAARAQGANFGRGFSSSGISGGAGGIGNVYARIFVSAAIGGTASKITGGKFINGASTAAFAAALVTDWGSQTEGFAFGKGEKVILGDSDNHGGVKSLYGGKVLLTKWGSSDARLSFSELGTVTSDLNDIFGTDIGQKYLDALTVEKPLKILLNSEGANGAGKLTRTMTVDLSTKVYFRNRIGTRLVQRASTTRLIAHEMGHAIAGLSDARNNVQYTDSIMNSINSTRRGQYNNQCRRGVSLLCR